MLAEIKHALDNGLSDELDDPLQALKDLVDIEKRLASHREDIKDWVEQIKAVDCEVRNSCNVECSSDNCGI